MSIMTPLSPRARAQFFHMATYSRRPNRWRQHVAQVLGEAQRLPEFSHHVPTPRPPGVVHGLSLRELEALHTQMVAEARTIIRKRDGTTTTRPLRQDRHTLATAIVSWPIPRSVVESDERSMKNYLDWRRLNIDWFEHLWGSDFQSLAEHGDEPYFHLHAYALPLSDPNRDAKRTCNPAWRLKMEAFDAGIAEGLTPGIALKKANLEYLNRARALQSEYYERVGAQCGLMRDGPRRRRWTRDEWHVLAGQAQQASDLVLRERIGEAARIQETADQEEARLAELAAMAVEEERRLSDLRRETEAVVAQKNATRQRTRLMAETLTQTRERLPEILALAPDDQRVELTIPEGLETADQAFVAQIHEALMEAAQVKKSTYAKARSLSKWHSRIVLNTLDALRDLISGEHDKTVNLRGINHLALMRRDAPDHRVTRGFMHRWRAFHSPTTGNAATYPEPIHTALNACFDDIAKLAEPLAKRKRRIEDGKNLERALRQALLPLEDLATARTLLTGEPPHAWLGENCYRLRQVLSSLRDDPEKPSPNEMQLLGVLHHYPEGAAHLGQAMKELGGRNWLQVDPVAPLLQQARERLGDLYEIFNRVGMTLKNIVEKHNNERKLDKISYDIDHTLIAYCKTQPLPDETQIRAILVQELERREAQANLSRRTEQFAERLRRAPPSPSNPPSGWKPGD